MYTAKGNGILFASEDKEFKEKYTRNKFKFKYGGYFNSAVAKGRWDCYINNDMYCFFNHHTGEKYSLEESIKIVHCLNCDKIPINNWRRYCCNCEYYCDKL